MTFDEHLPDWLAYTLTPWGRLRYTLVREVLYRHLPPGPLEVLDVGGADGLDAGSLVDLGHEVTVLDPAPAMVGLARAAGLTAEVGGLDDLPGRPPVDVVLCHYVLQYRPDEARDLRLLTQTLRPGGFMSVVLPNPDHRVLTAFLREGPDAALAELASGSARTLTFGTDMRKIPLARIEELLAGLGLDIITVHGGRIVGDLLQDNVIKHDPTFYAGWEKLELALAEREPYRRLGQFYGVLARRR